MSQENPTLYLKIPQNILVKEYEVKLCDIAKMECTDVRILGQLKNKKIYTFPKDLNTSHKHRLQAFSVLKIISQIHEDFPELEVSNVGETDFLVECRKGVAERQWLDVVKTAVLCVIIFFGAAFTIMAFNNDVAAGEVFDKLYFQVMGKRSNGRTELEICYAIGMPIGIMLFYNHVGKKKVTHDPTPIQVEMRKYEQDVDSTFLQNAGREGASIDVD